MSAAASPASKRRIMCFSLDCCCSRTEDQILALARVPWNGDALQQIENPEQNDADQRKHDESRKHGWQFEIADRSLQHEADAGVRADELADHRADHRKRDRDFQPSE